MSLISTHRSVPAMAVLVVTKRADESAKLGASCRGSVTWRVAGRGVSENRDGPAVQPSFSRPRSSLGTKGRANLVSASTLLRMEEESLVMGRRVCRA